MKIKYILRICNIDTPDESWNEDHWFSDNREEAQADAEAMIASFNRTLRPSEKPRKLLLLVEAEPAPAKLPAHQWEKTNLFTKRHGSRYYDTYRCRKCGVTGKRYGLGGSVTLDSKYRAKKYQHCIVE